MWLFLWILFVLAIVGIFAWSFHVIFEQKRAWKAFADKYGLDFIKGALLQPPAITGYIKGRLVNLYVQQNMPADHGRKSSTILEVFLTKTPDTVAMVASQGFVDFMTTVDLPEPFQVDDPDWPAGALSRTFEGVNPAIWFRAHKDRTRAVGKLMAMPYDKALVMDGEQAFLAMRMADPLADPRIINKFVSGLFEIARMLESDAAQLQQTEIEKPKESSVTAPSEPTRELKP